MAGEVLLHRANAVRAAQDYTMLSGYPLVPRVGLTGRVREYTDEGKFWRDVLDKTPGAHAVGAVQLRHFRLSRWVPRVPGLFWKDKSKQLRRGASQYRLPVDVVQGDAGGRGHDALFSPTGKTLRLLGGVGTVRLLPTVSGCLLVASSSGMYWRGVTVLLGLDVWLRLGNIEEGTLANLRGVWTPMPRDVAQGLGGEAGVPRNCVVVSEAADLTLSPDRRAGLGSAWTLFERRDALTTLPRLDFAYCIFRAKCAAPTPQANVNRTLEEGEAGEWLSDYINKYNGNALTDYDEQEPRLDPLLPINELMNPEVGRNRLRDFLDGVKQRAFSPGVVDYDALPTLLIKHFSADDLALLASDYLGLELENLASRSAAKAEQVMALVGFCREQKRLPELVVGVLRERPALSGVLAVEGQRSRG